MKHIRILLKKVIVGVLVVNIIAGGLLRGRVANINAGSKQLYIVQMSSKDSITTLSMTNSEAEKLKNNKGIISVENDSMMKGCGKRKNKENHINWDKTCDQQWNLKMINANGYKLTKSSSHDKIKVAIIDSGIDYSSDIDVCERKNFIPNQDDRSILYEDGSGHGTAVAGIIAAKRNDIGITGVNENVSLYSAKVLDENNQAPVSRVIQAIEWAIQKKVNIINLSLGMSQYSKALHDVIKRAVDENILIIAAVGNGTDIEYPAAFEETIAVGSIDANGQLSNRSATGDKVDVVAPGEQILSTSAFEGIMASSGTSMAVPHVTGIASILWQKNKNVSAEFIRKLICESAKNIGVNIDH